MRSIPLTSLAVLAIGCAGTDDTDGVDTDTDTQADIAVAGSWFDDWGTDHAVTNDTWASGDSSWALTRFSNDEGWTVGQNATTNEWNPDLWSRFDYTAADGSWFFCQSAYDASTEDAALTATPADPADLASGCGGFAWSALLVPLDIRGAWEDAWSEHQISETTWVNGASAYEVSDYDNAGTWLVAQNAAANEYNPGLWSRFDWAWSDGDLWYCQTAYAAETRDEALATSPADASDPPSSGCGGFSWTMLTPQ